MTTISTTPSVRIPPAPVPFTRNVARTSVSFSRGAAVLPCSSEWGNLNPSRPQSHALVEDGEQILVLAKWFDREQKPTRVLLSSGPMHITLGTFIELRHDQTQRRLGDYRIVGIVNVRADGNEHIGITPNRALNLAVFK